ncbi:MAG: C1 family peptidase [Gemmatimonadota bacterium]|nr:C1 family peptidase [Gemmatimonadota bacterium]
MADHRTIGSGWVEEEGKAHRHRALGNQRLATVLRDSAGAKRERLAEDEAAQYLPPRTTELPTSVDLRDSCGPVRFQGGFNTCNAHVVASLLEYFEKREHGKSVAPSRRFLFTVAKNFNQSEDASGVYIRQVMGVLRMIGVPPEKFWGYPEFEKDEEGKYPPWDEAFNEEPNSFAYALAGEYQATRYYRLDRRDEDGKLLMSPEALLLNVKKHLAGGIPVTLAFPMYDNVIDVSWEAEPGGQVPYPAEDDSRLGGHAVVTVGYDDERIMTSLNGTASTGAFLVQNSWGTEWGEDGFGWIAYEYVTRDRTRDFWTLIRAEWTETGMFQLGLIEDDEVDTG